MELNSEVVTAPASAATTSQELTTLKDIPSPLYFKVLLKEVRERAKLCEALSSFLDDFANTEEAFGKNLVKAGSHALTQSKVEWPARIGTTWTNISTFSEKLGKQHIGYATCLSQSVARPFHEHSKTSTLELTAFDTKIQSLYYDLVKARGKYERSYTKYVSLVQDAEHNIKARDSSVHDYASKGARETDVYDGFLNRSLTKMRGSMQTMGKFGPADALRKLDDRCLAQLEEIDICEDSLATGARVCNEIRKDLLAELVDCTNKIQDLEKNRIEFMKEGLERFCQACQGMLDHVDLLITEQINQAADIDFEAELEDLKLESIEMYKNAEEQESPDPYLSAIAVIEKLKEGIDSVKALILRSSSGMSELADAGKKYAKNCNRLVDRHGSSPSTTKGSSLSDTAAMLRVGPAIPAVQSFGALLLAMEAPLIRKGWEASLVSVSRFAEAYTTGSEVMVEKCCSSADALQRRTDSSKKEMIETLSNTCKRVDALSKTLSTTSKKLRGVRRELESLRLGGAVMSGSAAITLAGSPPEKGYLSGDDAAEHPMSEDEDLSLTAGAKHSSPDLAPHADPTDHPDVKPHKQRSTSMLLPSIASLDPLKFGSKLGAAAGFQSAADRKVNRISALEEEEAKLAEMESLSMVSLQNNEERAVSELSSAAETSKQNLSRDLLNMKMVLQILMDCHRLSLEICQKVVLTVKNEYESIDTDFDYKHFCSSICATVASISGGNSSYVIENAFNSSGTKASFATFEIPADEIFVPVHNSVVLLERQSRRASLISSAEGDNVVQDGKVEDCGEAGKLAVSNFSEMPAADSSLEPISTEPDSSVISETTRPFPSVSIEGFDDPDALNHRVPQIQRDLSAESSASVPPTNEGGAVTTKSHRKRKSKTRKSGSFVNTELKPIEQNEPTVGVVNTPNPNPEMISSTPDVEVGSTDEIAVEKETEAIVDAENVSESAETQPSSVSETCAEVAATLEVKETTEEKDTPKASPFPSPSRGGIGEGDSRPVNPFYTGGSIAPAEEAYTAVEPAEKILESFSCALYPKRGIMTHGRISVTTKNLTFSGWPECRVNIPLHYIASIDKTNTVMIIPNALLIKVMSGEEYFFGSFMERELCYNLLSSMVEVSKGLQEINGPEYSRNGQLSVGENIEQNDIALMSTISDIDQLSGELGVEDRRFNDNGDDEADVCSSDDDGVHPTNYEKIFSSDGIVHMHTEDLPVKSRHVWKYFWQNASGYRDFLVAQGDKDVTFTEWTICTENPPEDLCKLKYCYSRTIDFFHPRTDPMVGFMGPANASAQQMQYLYVDKPWQGGTDLSEMKYHKGIIFTVTQFQHIPMADVFKVLQFWSFEPKKKSAGVNSHETTVRMHVSIHYNKYTMLKSKILSGTKDDLVVLVKAWAAYIVPIIKAASGAQKKTKKIRNSSPEVDSIPMASADVAAGLLAETNAKIDKLEAIVITAVQQRKGEYSNVLYAVYALTGVVILQLIIIFRLWSGSA